MDPHRAKLIEARVLVHDTIKKLSYKPGCTIQVVEPVSDNTGALVYVEVVMHGVLPSKVKGELIPHTVQRRLAFLPEQLIQMRIPEFHIINEVRMSLLLAEDYFLRAWYQFQGETLEDYSPPIYPPKVKF